MCSVFKCVFLWLFEPQALRQLLHSSVRHLAGSQINCRDLTLHTRAVGVAVCSTTTKTTTTAYWPKCLNGFRVDAVASIRSAFAGDAVAAAAVR